MWRAVFGTGFGTGFGMGFGMGLGSYPGRFHMHGGDSMQTIANYVRRVRVGSAPQCDLWYVDGAHTGKAPAKDLQNAIDSARNGTTLIADDCTRHWGHVLDAWTRLLGSHKVRVPTTFPQKAFYNSDKSGPRHGSGFCAGVVVK